MKFPRAALGGDPEPADPVTEETVPSGASAAAVQQGISSDSVQRPYEIPLPSAGEPLGFRMKEFARLIALGKTNAEIAEKMGCIPGRVSIIRSIPEVHDEAERYRDRLFEGDVAERLKELNASAFGTFEKILRNPNAKDNLKLQAAQWILEKTTGKATQSLDIKSSTLEGFYRMVSEMQGRGETLDVTPAPASRAELPGEVPHGTLPEPEEDLLATFVAEET